MSLKVIHSFQIRNLKYSRNIPDITTSIRARAKIKIISLRVLEGIENMLKSESLSLLN